MSGEKYIIALDQGTTSSRSVLIDREGHMVDFVQRPFQQIFPHPGWVEHNPQDILFSQLGSLTELITKHGLTGKDIDSIGIDNQRETTIVWDPTTGSPVSNAIVWQCRRTAPIIDELCGTPEVRKMVQDKTGLLPDAYFSASKIRWILDNVPGARKRAEAGELLFGTVDTWLVWVLTGGLVHATDVTNASRTMLYNIHEGCWDKDLLDLFGIPESMMPEVRRSSGPFGETSYPGIPAGIPIMGVAGDQQAALFGQCCFEPGQAKNTYGTGCFMLLHTGREARRSEHSLVTTIVASPPDVEETEYALEGSVFVAGALIQWLRDELGIIQHASDTEWMAQSVEDTGGVYIVPAFTGLGAPWWKPDARGAIVGLTRGTTRNHIARAALEALAYQIRDLSDAMAADAGKPIKVLNVDGGASANDFLMQFQADILGCELRRPQNTETTSLGAAYLAGLATGFWSGTDELRALRETDDRFFRRMDPERADELLAGWHDAVRRVM
ncbi:MAG: glycerol kinase GlpK [Tractidigestivibacter sp.]|jgi:glycerol kinase|uniref:glycerol kinase GlpK n=1 Tax=Tractidigestivibacter sp. TaxID=2847320 RepID=UPI003D8F9E91